MDGFSLTLTAELNNRQLPTRGDPTSISLTVRSWTEGIYMACVLVNTVHAVLAALMSVHFLPRCCLGVSGTVPRNLKSLLLLL